MAQNKLSAKPDFPGTSRARAVSFVIGDNWYVGLGAPDFASQPFSDFYKYNAQSETWTKISDFPGAPRSQATAFVIGNKAYVGRGRGNEFETDFYQYNPETDVWRQVSTPPNPHPGFARASFIMNNNAYLVSNFGIEIFDPTTENWSIINSAGPPDGHIAFILSGIPYVVSGSSTYKYNLTTNQWTSLKRLSASASFGSHVLTHDNRVLIFEQGVHEFFANSPKPSTVEINFDGKQLSLDWESNADQAVGYTIDRAESAGDYYNLPNNFVRLAEVSKDQTSFIDESANTNKFYAYRLSTLFAPGISAPRYAKTNTIDSLDVLFNFAAPDKLVFSLPETYLSRWSTQIDSAVSKSVSVPQKFYMMMMLDQNHTINGIKKERIYHFKRSAIFSEYGKVPSRRSRMFALVNEPSNLTTADSRTSSHPIIQWEDNSSIETGYQVERSTKDEPFQVIANLSPNIESFEDETLPFEVYKYRVKALVDTISSPYSNTISINVVTSIADHEYPLTVHPNPTKGIVICKIKNNDLRDVQVFTIFGKKLDTKFQSNDQEVSLDLTNQPPGFYLIKVTTGTGIHSAKVLKL